MTCIASQAANTCEAIFIENGSESRNEEKIAFNLYEEGVREKSTDNQCTKIYKGRSDKNMGNIVVVSEEFCAKRGKKVGIV